MYKEAKKGASDNLTCRVLLAYLLEHIKQLETIHSNLKIVYSILKPILLDGREHNMKFTQNAEVRI